MGGKNGMQLPRYFRWYVLWFALLLGLLWPAAVNGGPFWFPDSGSYIRGADAAAVVFTRQGSEWSDRLTISHRSPGSGTIADADAAPANWSAEISTERPVLNNRSVYFGMLLYVPMRIFGPWGAVIGQAALVAAALTFLLIVSTRQFQRHRFAAAAAVAAGLIVVTPLPFYSCMLMPDVWSGVLIAMLALAICFRGQMNGWEVLIAAATACAITTFHNTHILLAFSMAIVAVLTGTGWRSRVIGSATCGVAAIFGLISVAVFSAAVERNLGQKPLSPPFLSARLSDEGPAIPFLASHCVAGDKGERFALCAYRDRLPLNSDNFLWSVQPDHGLFQLLSPTAQRDIAEEDKRFFLAVIADDPVAYVLSAARSWAKTLVSFDLKNFNYYDTRLQALEAKYPPAISRTIAATKSANKVMPTGPTVLLTIVSCVFSVMWFVYVMAGRARLRAISPNPVFRYGVALILGIMANAAICGALSKPDARYQMRLIWLLPFAAGLLLASQSSDRGAARPRVRV